MAPPKKQKDWCDNYMNINCYLKKIMNSNEIVKCLSFYNVDGILQSDILEDFICYSIHHSYIRKFLPNVFNFCDCSSVTPEVFDKIKRFPNKKIRKNIFIVLAHRRLSFYQLSYICNQNICFEAFAQLLDIYLINDCFSSYDLKILLEKNKKYLKAIDFTLLFRDVFMTDEKRELCKCYQKLVFNKS